MMSNARERRRLASSPLHHTGMAARAMFAPAGGEAERLPRISLAAVQRASASTLAVPEPRRACTCSEQETLVREIDHRVMNELQMVAAILGMQAAQLEDAKASAALMEASGRVRTVAHAHRLLRGPGLEHLAFKDYLNSLCADLRTIFALDGDRWTLQVHSDVAELPTVQAVPLAQAVNELVTNAFKHAFTARKRGSVTVAFAAHGAKAWRLVVCDDGEWVQRTQRHRHGLGGRLVRLLARQLDAHYSMEVSSAGTRAVLEIPRLPD
jgi:two-component sensor histidine kinase